jgi:hypothetical protein
MRGAEEGQILALEVLFGASGFATDEGDGSELWEKCDEIVHAGDSFVQLARRDLSRSVPPRNDVPRDGQLAGNACALHEQERGFRAGVVIVATDESGATVGCRHWARLLKQEQNLGIDSAVERIEVRHFADASGSQLTGVCSQGSDVGLVEHRPAAFLQRRIAHRAGSVF